MRGISILLDFRHSLVTRKNKTKSKTNTEIKESECSLILLENLKENFRVDLKLRARKIVCFKINIKSEDVIDANMYIRKKYQKCNYVAYFRKFISNILHRIYFRTNIISTTK